jgi:signal transduction histidine kinase
LAAGTHLAAAWAYGLQRRGFGLPGNWDPQFYALVSLSLAASVLAALRRGRPEAKGGLAVSILSVLLACYPIPLNSGIQLMLCLPLVVSGTAAFERPDYFFAGPAVIALLFSSRKAATVWGRAKSGPIPGEDILLFTVLGFAWVLAVVIRELDAARVRAQDEVEHLDSTIDRITDINASFQNSLALAEEEYARKERDRITRDVHDIVGYALTNQLMMIEAATVLAGPGDGRLRELLGMAKENVAEGLRETRRTLYGIRERDEARAPDFSLLLKLTRNFQAVTGIRVDVDFADSRGKLDPAVWMAIFRLIQESMTNALRHGAAQNISIFFRESEDEVRLVVRDDGAGARGADDAAAAEPSEGIGLRGMRERLEALGGRLRAGDAGGGFVVEAAIPKRPRKEEAK